MIQREELKGFWYLPNHPENKIPGTLFFIPGDEIRLELIGGIEFGIEDLLKTRFLEVIHGITHENEKVTLFFCHGYGILNFSSSFPLMNYKCKYLIRGKHIISVKDGVYDSALVDMTSLYDWYPAARIHNEIYFSDHNKQQKINLSLDDSTYWEEVIKLDDNFTIKFFGVGDFNHSFDLKSFELKQNTLFEILANNQKKSFFELLKKIEIFKQFLSLASLSTVQYLSITLYDSDDYQLSEKGNKIFNTSHLYFFQDKVDNARPSRYQFLFTHEDIIEIIPDILVKWYSIEQDLSPIRNHLIESIKTKKVFTSLDFLIIVQALEGYHRRFIDTNKRKLSVRINELYKLFGDIQKIKNSPININHVVKSRDYYSHFFAKDSEVLDGIELFELTEQLRILLICSVLQLIGFNKELISKIINKNEKL